MEYIKEIQKIIPKERLLENELMSKHTTFRIGGPADWFIIINTEEELVNVIKILKDASITPIILGNGSNVIVTDKGIRGIVIKINIGDIDINGTTITAGAGAKLVKISYVAKKHSCTGLEFASGIPGTLGGAIKMNAGAYGSEIKNVLVTTRCLNNDGEIVELTNKEQKFKYRHSIFFEEEYKNYIILSAKINLKEGDKKKIEARMKELSISRRLKQPFSYPSAGSVFKRGENYISSKLIDEADLKGCTIGGAQVSTLHAGFIVNIGNATANDVLQLIEHIKKTVYNKFKITLKEEVLILGDR